MKCKQIKAWDEQGRIVDLPGYVTDELGELEIIGAVIPMPKHPVLALKCDNCNATHYLRADMVSPVPLFDWDSIRSQHNPKGMDEGSILWLHLATRMMKEPLPFIPLDQLPIRVPIILGDKTKTVTTDHFAA